MEKNIQVTNQKYKKKTEKKPPLFLHNNTATPLKGPH